MCLPAGLHFLSRPSMSAGAAAISLRICLPMPSGRRYFLHGMLDDYITADDNFMIAAVASLIALSLSFFMPESLPKGNRRPFRFKENNPWAVFMWLYRGRRKLGRYFVLYRSAIARCPCVGPLAVAARHPYKAVYLGADNERGAGKHHNHGQVFAPLERENGGHKLQDRTRHGRFHRQRIGCCS